MTIIDFIRQTPRIGIHVFIAKNMNNNMNKRTAMCIAH